MLSATQTRIPQGFIDLGVGHPGLELLPLEALRQASQALFAQSEPHFLQYGAEGGDPELRRELAHFLTRHYGTLVEPQRLFISGGISQALDLLCAALTQPGQSVLVEDPTYFLALSIFRERNLRVVGVPRGDFEALEAALHTHRPVLYYTVPTFHNPTGASLSHQERQKLLQLAEEHGLWVVADEVYHLLSYGSPPPPPLGTLASERVISLGSFSKILAPGLRLGWVQAAPSLLERLERGGVVQSGGGLNPFVGRVVAQAMAMGLQETHLQQLRGVYSRRLAALLEALKAARLPVQIQPPQGGYFVWLELPPEQDASRLLQQAREEGVAFQPGMRFSPSGSFRNALRLCFAHYPEEGLLEGVRRLERAMARG
ncbi:PLP-dependent aminotransferase family protein [Calidithermus roseus]|uniref:2-aminoadipate transaminase n=1 Tax=Calidithermus roseus TaxID=1644118 RepID=A0A399EYH1_9DEIN|nr:PLP-dependent aminotransferase family protein [Calidithermus roseus]RIH88813.1 2-aminoadipate transaminase [Calidithermus roseus]